MSSLAVEALTQTVPKMASFWILCRALLLCAVFAVSAEAQSFLTAISQFPELSNFTTLMYDNPGLAGALLTSNATSLTQITVLVPDNSAFDKLEAQLGAPIGSLTVEQLEPILQYLVMVGEWTTNNFTVQNGTTVPTLLTGPLYNNRSAGAALGSSGASNDPHNGQVVFVEAINSGSSPTKRFALRQLAPPIATVQGGLGHQINMTAVDGYWDGGVFQIVDKLVQLDRGLLFSALAYPVVHQIPGSSFKLHQDNHQVEPDRLCRQFNTNRPWITPGCHQKCHLSCAVRSSFPASGQS